MIAKKYTSKTWLKKRKAMWSNVVRDRLRHGLTYKKIASKRRRSLTWVREVIERINCLERTSLWHSTTDNDYYSRAEMLDDDAMLLLETAWLEKAIKRNEDPQIIKKLKSRLLRRKNGV